MTFLPRYVDGAASDEADAALAMLQGSIPGVPGEDYPIYSEVPETAFSCDGQVDGGEAMFSELICNHFLSGLSCVLSSCAICRTSDVVDPSRNSFPQMALPQQKAFHPALAKRAKRNCQWRKEETPKKRFGSKCGAGQEPGGKSKLSRDSPPRSLLVVHRGCLRHRL